MSKYGDPITKISTSKFISTFVKNALSPNAALISSTMITSQVRGLCGYSQQARVSSAPKTTKNSNKNTYGIGFSLFGCLRFDTHPLCNEIGGPQPAHHFVAVLIFRVFFKNLLKTFLAVDPEAMLVYPAEMRYESVISHVTPVSKL